MATKNNNMFMKYLHSFYSEIVYGPGTKHLLKVLFSPIGLLGSMFLFIAIMLAFIPNSQAKQLRNILWFVFFYIALAESWNIIGGYAGEVDFGHVLFAAVGMYSMAILINDYNLMSIFSLFGDNYFTSILLPLLLGIFISGILATLVSIVIGIPALKLRGSYFAITMLASSQALLIIFSVDKGIPFFNTNGGSGVNVSSLLQIIPDYTVVVYILIIGVSIVAFLIVHYVSYTRLGLSLRAIKGSQDGAASIGINVLWTKLQAFSISAFIAGIAGAVYMLAIYDITPKDAFNVHVTIEMIIITLIGGPASVFGPIIGAIIVWPMRSLLTQFFAGISFDLFGTVLKFDVAYLLIYGLLFIIAVLYLPKGIIGLLEDKGILKRESLISDEDFSNKTGGMKNE
jgi:branched-chain amino acid transport system permease protein